MTEPRNGIKHYLAADPNTDRDAGISGDIERRMRTLTLMGFE